jgi:uncharacterized protein (TIGR02145 family)
MDQAPLPPNNKQSPSSYKLATSEVQGPKPPLVGKNNSKLVFGVVILIIICIAGGAGYYYYKNNYSAAVPSIFLAPSPSPTPDPNFDSDDDGIPDVVEAAIGANLNNVDTDGDSYGDLDEVKNGYSPLIAGGTGKYTAEEWQAVKDAIKAADGKFYESVFESIAASSGFICGTNTVNDIDGNIYNTVSIGSQCWLKENLKVTKNPAGVAITRYCYGNDQKICDTDGGLYDWNTTMNGSTTEGAQGVCPNGWHVPKDSEWYILEKDLATDLCSDARTNWGCDSAGTKIKPGGSSGFNSVLAGVRAIDGSFSGRGAGAFLWSSTVSGSRAWTRALDLGDSSVYRDDNSKAGVFSVRCLKD